MKLTSSGGSGKSTGSSIFDSLRRKPKSKSVIKPPPGFVSYQRPNNGGSVSADLSHQPRHQPIPQCPPSDNICISYDPRRYAGSMGWSHGRQSGGAGHQYKLYQHQVSSTNSETDLEVRPVKQHLAGVHPHNLQNGGRGHFSGSSGVKIMQQTPPDFVEKDKG